MSRSPTDLAGLDLLARDALAEMQGVVNALPGDLAARFLAEVRPARRTALYGVGREGLVMRALAMRLYHAGKRAFMVGDMAAEPLGPGDLLIVSAGPGFFSTVSALMAVSRQAGARTLIFSAEPQGASAQLADTLLHLPAQTMHSDRSDRSGVLPMGSLYELSLWLLCDLLIEQLKVAEQIGPEGMRARHTNLE